MKVFCVILVLLVIGALSNVKAQAVSSRAGAAQTVQLKYVCSSGNEVRLRLLNNTKWNLSIRVDEIQPRTETSITLANGVKTYAAPNYKPIPVQYQLEKFALPNAFVHIPRKAVVDTGFSEWVAAQNSVLFSVSKKYLRQDLQVFVRLNYEWEMGAGGSFDRNPEHRIYFRGIDIPASVQKCSD